MGPQTSRDVHNISSHPGTSYLPLVGPRGNSSKDPVLCLQYRITKASILYTWKLDNECGAKKRTSVGVEERPQQHVATDHPKFSDDKLRQLKAGVHPLCGHVGANRRLSIASTWVKEGDVVKPRTVVLLVGTTMFQGIGERMTKDLTALAPSTLKIKGCCSTHG